MAKTAKKDATVKSIVPEAPKPYVPGITGASESKVEQPKGDHAKQPDIQGQTNANVVNPVAPTPEPQGVNEAIERAVAVPDARPEPTLNEFKYQALLGAFNKLADSHHFDPDFLRNLKKEAGIL